MVSLVLWNQKAVVHKEFRIALESIGIIDLLSASNVVGGFNDKALLFLVVKPGSLARTIVVEHICEGAQSDGALAVQLDSENSAADGDLCVQELIESHRKIIRLKLFAESFEVFLQRLLGFEYHVVKWTAFEQLKLILSKTNGVLLKRLWKSTKVVMES